MFESHSATPACAETRDADIAFAGGIFALLHAAARRGPLIAPPSMR